MVNNALLLRAACPWSSFHPLSSLSRLGYASHSTDEGGRGWEWVSAPSYARTGAYLLPVKSKLLPPCLEAANSVDMQIIRFTSFGNYLVNLINTALSCWDIIHLQLCPPLILFTSLSVAPVWLCTCAAWKPLSVKLPPSPLWIIRIQLLFGAKVPKGSHGPITKDYDFLLV